MLTANSSAGTLSGSVWGGSRAPSGGNGGASHPAHTEDTEVCLSLPSDAPLHRQSTLAILYYLAAFPVLIFQVGKKNGIPPALSHSSNYGK